MSESKRDTDSRDSRRGATTGYAVGDKVKAIRDIWEDATGDSPGGILAERGDVLEIRGTGDTFPYYVAHPDRKPGEMFGVKRDEIQSGYSQ